MTQNNRSPVEEAKLRDPNQESEHKLCVREICNVSRMSGADAEYQALYLLTAATEIRW